MISLNIILSSLQDSMSAMASNIKVSINGDLLNSDALLLENIELHDLSLDSRSLEEYGAFLAVKGEQFDGRDFIVEAIKRKANAIFYDIHDLNDSHKKLIESTKCVCIGIPDLVKHVSVIASAYYQNPSEKLQVYGITGTNGKTSCAYLLAQCFNRLGYKTAFMGTIGVGSPDALNPTTHTTLDAVNLQAELAKFIKMGFTHVCMEVSSHALDQYRVAAVNYYAVLFTNLSQDHLDYHKDMHSYGLAKKRLFTDFKPVLAVINVADSFGQQLMDEINADFVVTYGTENNTADVLVEEVSTSESGLRIIFDCQTQEIEVQSTIIGLVNVPNIALAVSVLLALGVELKDIQSVIGKSHSAPGRMELFTNKGFPKVVVDFAHTPDAIKQAILSCRVHCEGKLWIIFGCGGDRDQSKRSLMGQVAEKYADVVLLSSDNPRSEQPEKILENIVSGMNIRPMIIQDRAEAVSYAIEKANTNDLILIAGKGHEQGQIIGDQTLPYSDREWARKCLRLAA